MDGKHFKTDLLEHDRIRRTTWYSWLRLPQPKIYFKLLRCSVDASRLLMKSIIRRGSSWTVLLSGISQVTYENWSSQARKSLYITLSLVEIACSYVRMKGVLSVLPIYVDWQPGQLNLYTTCDLLNGGNTGNTQSCWVGREWIKEWRERKLYLCLLLLFLTLPAYRENRYLQVLRNTAVLNSFSGHFALCKNVFGLHITLRASHTSSMQCFFPLVRA